MSEEKMSHTDLPWRVVKDPFIQGTKLIMSPEGLIACLSKGSCVGNVEANADFIVRAVNAYKEIEGE